jgi:hypothetical protein
MALFKRGNVWWYEFWFAGRRIRESSKTGSKTVAKAAEQKRRRELGEGFNNLEDVRQERVRTVREIADEYLESYRPRRNLNVQPTIKVPAGYKFTVRVNRDVLFDAPDQPMEADPLPVQRPGQLQRVPTLS